MSKKSFRLENGTEVTSSVGVYRAYVSKRNKERYLQRKQYKFVKYSLDDENAQKIADDEDLEETVETRLYISELRKAIRLLTSREQGIVIDYFFNGFSYRKLGKKYGVSHTKVHNEMKSALAKLRQYITDKKSETI